MLTMVSCFRKPRIENTKYIEYHGFGFGIGYLPNQTDWIPPLVILVNKDI